MRICIIIIALITLFSCKHKNYQNIFNDGLLFSKTVKQLNNVVKQNNFPPIIASRNYTYATIAAYEVIALADKRFISLAGQIKHLPEMPKVDTQQVNFQYAAILAFCQVGEAVTFPEGSMKGYLQTIDSLTTIAGMPTEVKVASKNLADIIAKHIMKWSKGDKYLQTRTAERYEITDEEGRWVPTPPAYTSALEPHWNLIRPMVMDSASQFKAPPPFKFDVKNKNSLYYKQMKAVYDTTNNLTVEQKHIAEFWDDLGSRLNVQGHVMFVTKKFSPPGHWMNIVGIAAKNANCDFSTTVSAYAKTAIATFDAFIQCWDEKYRNNTVRPETVINKYLDPEWRPFLQTPPFPEYTCGHSTCSAAAAEVLTSIFGDHFMYTDTSELEFGINNRSFQSFKEAALENNRARFYGGIHFHPSCLISTQYGSMVGLNINKKIVMKK